jgi:anti-sigma regulatory factor (Ser/Thr protein kinase)
MVREERRTAMASNKGKPPGEFRLVLSPEPGAAAKAREAVRDQYSSGVGTEVLDDLLTVISELVNNAVLHGPGKPITVTLVMGEESVHGEVADQGNPAVAIPKIREATAPADSGGFGLNLVDKLTAGWAVYEGSTHVWFELPLETHGTG